MPSRSAITFAGGAATLRPRPAGRSGRVNSAATSWRAASRSSTSAPNGAVAATAILTQGGYVLEGLAERRERLTPRLVGRAREHQHTVEVVDLMLDDAGVHLVELESKRCAREILPLDGDVDRAL